MRYSQCLQNVEKNNEISVNAYRTWIRLMRYSQCLQNVDKTYKVEVHSVLYKLICVLLKVNESDCRMAQSIH